MDRILRSAVSGRQHCDITKGSVTDASWGKGREGCRSSGDAGFDATDMVRRLSH